MVRINSVNPTITDSSDSRFTELVNHPNRWLMTGFIGDADVYSGRGSQHIHSVHNLTKEVSVGDFVLLGNRQGVVTELVKDSSDVLIGLKVYEDMRYLPFDYWDNPSSFGYNNDTTKQGRTVNYVFGKDSSSNGIRNGGGAVVLFQGMIQVVHQYTNDPASWNKVAQAAAQYQEQQEADS